MDEAPIVSLYLEPTVVVVLVATASTSSASSAAKATVVTALAIEAATAAAAAPAVFASSARLLRVPAVLARIRGSRVEALALALSLALVLCVRCVVVATTTTKMRGHIHTTGDRVSGSLACYGAAIVSRAAIQVQTSNLKKWKKIVSYGLNQSLVQS